MSWLVLDPPATTLERALLAFAVDGLVLALLAAILTAGLLLAVWCIGGALSPPSLDTSEGGWDA